MSAAPEKPLLWVLREDLGLTGAKFGCGIGVCKACTVHVNGAAAQGCVLPIGELAGRHVVTIEGLAVGEVLHAVQRAWIDAQVPQCGYCHPGFVMAVSALLAENAAPSAEDLDRTLDNVCRCGTYTRVRRALAALLRGTGTTPRTGRTSDGDTSKGTP